MANAPDVLADYLRRVKMSERSTQTREVDIVVEGAGRDLP